MMCSARSLGLPTSSRTRAASSAASPPRGRVPAIGRVSIRDPRTASRRSGDDDSTDRPAWRNRPANGAGLARRSAA